MKKIVYCLFLSFGLHFSLSSQNYYIVKGKVYDAKDNLTLPQAHISIDEKTGSGAVSDIDGNYIIAVEEKSITLVFMYLGYEPLRKTIEFKDKKEITLNVGLKPSANEIKGVVIEGQRFKSDVRTSIQSLQVIGMEHIEKANITTLNKALDNVSGLAVVDNEPQMRGGSGFSSGLGSRVMILYDEMPIMRADAGRPVWNLIPMEEVSQIEILKGASSVMFGSAAINGAINVRSNIAKPQAETKAKLYGGFYMLPRRKEIAAWSSQSPLLYGASLSHGRKIGKLDISISAEFAQDDGYRSDTLPNKQKASMVERAEQRFRANLSTQYRINERWILSLGGNFLYSNNRQFYFWHDAEKGLYGAYPGTMSNFNDLMLFIDPCIKYISPEGGIHSFKNRILFSENTVLNIKNQNAASKTFYDEYNYKKIFKKADDLELLAGISNQYAQSIGSVFSGNTNDIGSQASHFVDNLAIFAKIEKSFLKDKNLTAILGARLEMVRVDDFTETVPVFQGGLNYFIPQSYTYFRGSIGQGYRAATIAEKFITVVVGDYGFFPNPELKSETSINTEIGVKQMFKLGSLEGFLDLAGFYQTYDNYIEFFMGPWRKNAPTTIEQFGFKFFNTGKAYIKGLETTIAAEGQFTEYFKYQFMLAYTYSLPLTKEPEFVYVKTSNLEYSYANSSSNTSGNILKYRIQHLAKADVNLRIGKMFHIGFSVQYFSQMKNIDKIFYELDKNSDHPAAWLKWLSKDLPFQGIQKYMQAGENGAWVFALRAGMEIGHFGFMIIVNNLLNKEYSLRPLYMEAPRNISLQLSYKFGDLIPHKLFNKQSNINNQY